MSGMSDSLTDPEVSSALVRVLLALADVTQHVFGERADRCDSSIWRYKTGEIVPPPAAWEGLASAGGQTVPFLETCLAPVVAAAVGVSAPLPDEALEDVGKAAAALERVVSGPIRAATLELVQALEAVEGEPWAWTGAPKPEDRLWAEDACRRLASCSAEDRRFLVETFAEFQTWAVAAELCELSEQAAADQADAALEWADLAIRVAELSQGDDLWHTRLRGYCLLFVANAQRVGGYLSEAEATFTEGLRRWEEGAPADPGVLAEWRRLDLQASLRNAQRRPSAALDLLARARAAAPVDAHGRILLKKASTLEQNGEPELAMEALREAGPLLDEQREPRNVWVQRFNLCTCLCGLDRYEEAEALLPDVRRLTAALGKQLDGLRVRWLEGKVAAGLGRAEEARAAFEEVRRAFETREIAYDGALVNLDLAMLLLEQRRTAEVRSLAEEMKWIFKAEGVEREELAALTVFCEAARQEAATVEMARRVHRFLERSRHDPDARFEA